MKPPAATLTVASLVLLLVGRDGWSSDKQDQENALAIAHSASEKQALAFLEQDKQVSARRLAEQALLEDPDSVIGHYALGRVLFETEGELGQAIFHLGRARVLYETRFPIQDASSGPWRFHRDLLFTIAGLAGAMEEYDYQLEMLDYHDAIYRPPLVGEHAWPLMKLGRLDEARKAAEAAKALKAPEQRSLGMNTLCAIERMSGNRARAHEACVAALDHARAAEVNLPAIDAQHVSTVAVHAFNAALAARANLAFDEAERLALEGAKRLSFTPANPWRFLVGYYADAGRGSDAANALRAMHAWRVRQPPQLRDQDRSETDAMVATMLMLSGRTEPALRLIDRAMESPDRRGLSSTEAWQARGANALLRLAIRRANREVATENAAGRGSARELLRAADAGIDRWADQETVIGALGDDARLIDTFRVFGEKGLSPVPVWLLGDLVNILGPGVTAVVVKQAKKAEPDPRFLPYLEAIEADIHLARGRTAEARQVAVRVAGALLETEVLLRARMFAIAAQAARDDDDGAAELAYLVSAYRLDPSVLRRHRLSLPARIESNGGPDADLARSALARSPRFRSGSAFIVNISGAGYDLRICLRGPDGAELRCSQAPAPPPTPNENPVGVAKALPPPMTPARAVELFHQQAFAMPLGLTGTDMASLDGSTTVAEQAVRENIDKLLDDITAPPVDPSAAPLPLAPPTPQQPTTP